MAGWKKVINEADPKLQNLTPDGKYKGEVLIKSGTKSGAKAISETGGIYGYGATADDWAGYFEGGKGLYADKATIDQLCGYNPKRLVNTIYSDYRFSTAGSASSLVVYYTTSTSEVTKIRVGFWKKTNSKSIVLKCEFRKKAGETPSIYGVYLKLYCGSLSVSTYTTSSSFQKKTLKLDISSLTPGNFYEIRVVLYAEGTLATGERAEMRRVEILEVVNTEGDV